MMQTCNLLDLSNLTLTHQLLTRLNPRKRRQRSWSPQIHLKLTLTQPPLIHLTPTQTQSPQIHFLRTQNRHPRWTLKR